QGTTLCRSIDGVSLFDFARADWAWIFENNPQRHYWRKFLEAPQGETPADSWIAIVWMLLDREKLPALMSVQEARAEWRGGDLSRKWIPWVETCHRGAAPLAACSKAVVICAVEPKEFRVMTMRPFDLSELDQLESDWRVRHADKYEFRALPGVEKIA